MNALYDIQREAVAVKQQVFLVFDVVVKRTLGYMQVFGNFIQRGAGKPLRVEKPSG